MSEINEIKSRIERGENIKIKRYIEIYNLTENKEDMQKLIEQVKSKTVKNKLKIFQRRYL